MVYTGKLNEDLSSFRNFILQKFFLEDNVIYTCYLIIRASRLGRNAKTATVLEIHNDLFSKQGRTQGALGAAALLFHGFLKRNFAFFVICFQFILSGLVTISSY